MASICGAMWRPFSRKLISLRPREALHGRALIRIETRAGHGTGKPTGKIIEEIADRWAFLGKALGMNGG
jgi:prolyl oligopeptidase PreP (S9A serine peptidase family)